MNKEKERERKVMAQFEKRKIKETIPIKKEVIELCQKDNEGNVYKSQINTENYERLRHLIKSIDIEVAKDKDFSYRQYCKLFDSYITKEKKCGGKICCQAITDDGLRCKRPASDYAMIDLTGKNLTPKIPQIVKQNLGAKYVEELKLIGFARSCCFYCSQHAKIYAVELLTWSHNLIYYTTHVEDLLAIFFKDIKPKKFYGTITYGFHNVGNLRSVPDIVKIAFSTHSVSTGAMTEGKRLFRDKGLGINYYYLGMKLLVFFEGFISPYIMQKLEGTKEKKDELLDNIVLTAAEVLLAMEHKIN